MASPISIANRVRELREKHGLMTQAELGELVGVTRQTIAAIEKRQLLPSLKNAFRISRVFKIPIDEVFSWEE